MANYADYSEEYAECYDFITQHKCYLSEVYSLVEFLGRFDINKEILSVGCGTGSHEYQLAKNGFKVFGIDKSEWMVNRAVLKSASIPNLSFGLTYDHAEQYLKAPFHCIVSLFNVINCLPDLSSLHDFFNEIFLRMERGGVFVFEAWNGMECLLNPPKRVSRDFNDGQGNYLHRNACPKLTKLNQHLQIEYKISGFINGRSVELDSIHDIRLFTVNEILYLLSSIGFENVQVFSSLPSLEPFDMNSSCPPRMLAFSAIK